METWQEVLDSIPVPPPARTGIGPFCGVMEPVPKVALFDVYGTLVRPAIGDLEEQVSTRTGPASFQHTAVRFGLDPSLGARWRDAFFSGIRSVHQEIRKLGVVRPEVLVEWIWKQMLADTGVQVDLNQARSFAMAAELLANPVAPFEGAAACLRELRGAGIRLGLASNSQFYTVPVLSKVLGLNVKEFFQREISVMSFELGFAKPDPHFFLQAKTRIAIQGFEPRETVLIGNDLNNDILAAREVGFRALLFHGDEQSAKVGKDLLRDDIPVVYNYRDLARALGVEKQW